MVVYYSSPKKLRHMFSVISLQNKSNNNFKNNNTCRTKFCLVKQNRKRFKIQQYNSPERRKPVIISIITKKHTKHLSKLNTVL